MGQIVATANGDHEALRRTAPPREVLAAEALRVCAEAVEALEREDAITALDAAATAVRLARRSGDGAVEGRARSIYGRSLGFNGRLRSGLSQIDRAAQLLEGADLGAALIHQGALLYKVGKPAAALVACERALELLPDSAVHHRARALNNIGIFLLYLGRHEEGRRSLTESMRLHLVSGQPAYAAQTHGNLAMAIARAGDLAGSLRAFDAAAAELHSLGLFEGQNLVAKAEVLLDAGLGREVQRELPPVIAALNATGMRVDAAEGQLYLALGLLSLGDPGAIDAARDARQRFCQVGSAGWAAMAGLVEVRARCLAGAASEASLTEARRVVVALAHRRLRPYELEARLLCGQLAERLGRTAEARRMWREVASERERGPVRQRALGWEALARLRLLEGNRSGSLRAADAGLRAIERHRDAIGAADLRAGASSQGVELAGMALRLAITGHDAGGVLRWAERWRAGALYRGPVLPPSDPLLADLLNEVRRVARAIRREAGSGRTTDELERQMARLERAVDARVRSRALPRDVGSGSRRGPLDIDDLRQALGGRALVEYVECDGALMAVVVDDRRCVLRPLGRAEDAELHARSTLFALRKLARLGPRSPAVAPALAGFRARLGVLERTLVGPIRSLVEGRDTVVVPTGRLHAIPWRVLVGDGAAVSVAPSAALWQRAACARRPPGGAGDVVAVAGPGLPGAAQEIDLVRRHHATSTALEGDEATVKAVSAAIDGAGLVHLAAHGDLRGDNPLFSSFRLVDGPQTVYDLQCLAEPPDVVVLSACNSALSQVDAGDELLGLVSSLLGLGTTTAIAAVLPIPDLATVPLMDRLHQRMAAGDRPGEALSAAAAQLDPGDPGAVAASAAFVCLGAA